MIGNLISARKLGKAGAQAAMVAWAPCLLAVFGEQGFKRSASAVAKCRHAGNCTWLGSCTTGPRSRDASSHGAWPLRGRLPLRAEEGATSATIGFGKEPPRLRGCCWDLTGWRIIRWFISSRTGYLLTCFRLTQGITFARPVLAISVWSWQMAGTHPSALVEREHKRVGIAKLACQEFENPYRNSKETAS